MSGVNFDGERAMANLRNLVTTLDQPVVMMAKAGLIVQKSVQENFDVGGRPAWAPLAVSTIRGEVYRRQRRSKNKDTTGTKASKLISNRRILVRTGKLMKSLQKASAIRVNGKELVVGTSVFYSRFHQAGEGGEIARPFLLLQPEDRDAIQKMTAETIKGVLAK